MENGMTEDEFNISYNFVKEIKKIQNYCTCNQNDGYGFSIDLKRVFCLNCNKQLFDTNNNEI